MTDRRREADHTGNKLLENQTKVLVNSAYGSCIKSIHRYTNTSIVNEMQLNRAIRSSRFHDFTPIGPLAELAESNVVLDQKVLDEENETPTGEGALYELTTSPRFLKYKQAYQVSIVIHGLVLFGDFNNNKKLTK